MHGSSLTVDRRLGAWASPAALASPCQALPGFVWLDSAVAGQAARSIIAAEPLAIVSGTASEWPGFEAVLAEFQRADSGGAAIGWVEYEGSYQFGFYDQPVVFDHDTSQWSLPGGPPSWLANLPEGLVRQPAWNDTLDFLWETTDAEYRALVAQAQGHIAAGDIYQVNLTHRAKAVWPSDGDAFGLYLALRQASPAPQSAYLALGERRRVLSASPESFLRFRGRQISTRPIKGTRPRGSTMAEDAAAAAELLASAKERAELLMITDLLRNDLGQVCEYGSVHVTELCQLERFAQVHHLVSTIEGRLRSDISQARALHRCLPGGSITGAPKHRARQIIAELEPGPRGLYSGTIGAFMGNGESAFNIAIRTLIIEDGFAHFHVGAGIVADSDPQQEWRETLHKASGILQASRITS